MVESGSQNDDEEDDGLTVLIVQYRVEGWGTAEDLDKRHRVEDLLNGTLELSETGYCDGGDIGSGTMNVCCYVIDPASTSQLVIEKLAANELLIDATVAYEEDDDKFAVVWPKGHTGDFSY